MIFATVGSHPSFRFDRFLEALGSLPGDELVVQHGPGRAPSHAHRAVPWLSFPDFLEHLDRADKVIAHAGAGTILCARQAGHVPVVVPRLRRFNETVDDHQLHFARALDGSGGVIAVEDLADLARVVEAAPSRGLSASSGDGALVAAVGRELRVSGRRSSVG